MIIVTKPEFDKVQDLRKVANIRGKHINTRIVYELWHKLFGVKKVPNGCSNCLKTDLRTFLTKWIQLEEAGEIQLEGAIGPDEVNPTEEL